MECLGLRRLYIPINIESISKFLICMVFLCGSSVTIRYLPMMFNVFLLTYAVLFFFYLYKNIREKTVNSLLIVLLIYYFIVFISTTLGNRNGAVHYYFFQNISVVLFINYELEKAPVNFTYLFEYAFFIIIALNLIGLIIKPDGFRGAGNTAFHLLGYRIAFTPYVFAASFLSVLLDRFDGHKYFSMKSICILAISFITVILKDVGTGLVALLIFGVISLLVILLDKSYINIWIVFLAYAVGWISIVIFEVQYNVSVLHFLLEDLLGRDLTFDNRTYIWKSTWQSIMDRPWLGYGTESDALIVFPLSLRTAPAHNQILCVISDSGFIGLFFFLAMLIIIGLSISRISTRKVKGICVGTMLSLLIIFFTEIQMYKCLTFIVYAYLYKASYLDENKCFIEKDNIRKRI